MKYIKYAVVGLVVLFSTAYAEIQELGNGQYVAVIQSDTSQTGPERNWSVEYYMQIDTIYDDRGNIVRIDTTTNYINYAGALTGSYSYRTATNCPIEKFRNWHEFSLWEIPDSAIIDSVKLVLTNFYLYSDSISIDVVNLNNNPPSSQFPQDLWNQIGTAATYVNNTKIYHYSHEPEWKLPGADNTIQSRLGTADEWFATGFRSNWENRDSVLLETRSIQLWVYFKVKPQIHVDRPNGGETFYIGLVDTIRWTASDYDNYVSSVDILLSRDGGTTYTLIGQVNNTQHLNPWNGEYAWMVTGPASDQCKVKVIAYDTDGVSGQDISDNVFSIENLPPPQVELLWPDAPGIVVEEADTYAIRYNGDAAAGIKEVKAWFSYDGGQTWTDTIGHRSYDPHNPPTHVENDTIDWPVTQHPTEHGRVKVVLYDAANQTAVDISSYDITVKLARPGNVAASVSSNLDAITLTWTDRSNYEDGYVIERKDLEHDWTLLDTLPANSESFTDNNVQPYKEYLYRIKTFNNDGDTSRTVEVPAFSYPSYAVYVPSGSDIHQIHGHGPVFVKYENSYYWVYADSGVIKVRESSDGITWGAPIVISGSLSNCSSPSITVSEDGIPAVVFKHDKDIYYTYKNSSWALPKKVNMETPVWMGIPSIAAKSSNDVVVAWVDSLSSSNYTSLKVAEFALGDNITTNMQLTPMGPISDTIARKARKSPSVLAFNNTFYVFYYDDYNIGYYYKSGQEWTYGSRYLTPERQIISDFSASVVGGRIYVVWFEFNDDNYNDNSIQTRKLYASGGLSPVETVRENITVTFEINSHDTVFMPDVHVFGDDKATFITWEEIDTTYENWLEEAYGANPPCVGPYPPRRVDLTYKSTGYDWNQTVELSPATVGHQWSLSPMFTRSRYSFSGYTYHINFVTAGALDLMEYHLRTFLKKQDITIVPASSPLGDETMVNSRLTIEPLASVIKGDRRIGVKLLLPEDCDVSLRLYDPSGREISRIPAHRYESGHHVVYFERKGIASGVYFLRANAGDKVITRKFLVLK